MKGNIYNSIYVFILVFLVCMSFATVYYRYVVLEDFEYVLPEEEVLEESSFEEETTPDVTEELVEDDAVSEEPEVIEEDGVEEELENEL